MAGLKAMGKGHSFECAKYLFLPSKSWALDENEQFIHRVWRLNSPADVHIFTFATQNTIDDLMDADFNAKLDSAQLGLDGCLIEQQVEEVDLAQLLEKAVRTFDPHAPTIDEAAMEREWEDSLRHQLAAAEAAFRLYHRAQGAQLAVSAPPSPRRARAGCTPEGPQRSFHHPQNLPDPSTAPLPSCARQRLRSG